MDNRPSATRSPSVTKRSGGGGSKLDCGRAGSAPWTRCTVGAVRWLVWMIDDATSGSWPLFVEREANEFTMAVMWECLDRERPQGGGHAEVRVIADDCRFSFAGDPFQIARQSRRPACGVRQTVR